MEDDKKSKRGLIAGIVVVVVILLLVVVSKKSRPDTELPPIDDTQTNGTLSGTVTGGPKAPGAATPGQTTGGTVTPPVEQPITLLTYGKPDANTLNNKESNQVQYFSHTVLQAVEYLKAADVDKLMGITHPLIIDQNTKEGLENAYKQKYIPFFTDYKSLDEATETMAEYTPDKYGANGMFFGVSFLNSNSVMKNFVIGVVEYKGRIYITEIDTNTTLTAVQQTRN